MKKISSNAIFFHKKIFPVIWFVILGGVLCAGLILGSEGRDPGKIFIILPICMAAFGYFFMKKYIWTLIDEVYDEGASLLFRSKGKEVRVNLKDIKDVGYSTIANPPRVTLNIHYTTELGDELTFAPLSSWIPFQKNRDIKELIVRINRAQKSAGPRRGKPSV
ncbi:MAG: hypothetical protein ABFD98_20130 [Syntrophobacteraceae bacterium]|nr:hypothetical protein [Desulfobacteraceae bacterium]